ncbi:MAG: C25 family cysteine peptidase [Planctomycetota bacterium]
MTTRPVALLATLCALNAAHAAPVDTPTSLLLITADSLVEAWQPFADWKTQQGKRTAIVTVDQILERYEADTVQEAIRLCVRDHIDHHGTEWVLLGGDAEGVGGLVPGGHTTYHRQEPAGIPTDIVYLSPTDWDADNDGRHGEFDDDRDAITYPDGSVGLGRVPVRTGADVRAFTEKVVAYESAYPENGFATRMVYTCTDAPAYNKVRASWDRYVSEGWDADVRRLFNHASDWDPEGEPGGYDLSSHNVVSLINEGAAGKVHIHGHGLIDRWILERSHFTAHDIDRLTNARALPLITTVSCFTGQYDDAQDPCIVESMLRAPAGGSVAIVAPVRTGKPHMHTRDDYRLMVREGKLDGTTMTMTQYWAIGLSGGLTTGEALMNAKRTLIDDARRSASYHLCICEINLLGDPTLDMRPRDVRTPSVGLPEAPLATGPGTLTVRTDAPGATVCAWMRGGVYEVARADETGVATLAIDPHDPGELLVTVSGKSLNTVARTVPVVTP